MGWDVVGGLTISTSFWSIPDHFGPFRPHLSAPSHPTLLGGTAVRWYGGTAVRWYGGTVVRVGGTVVRSGERHPTRAVVSALLGAHADRVLIVACNLMLCPIHRFRP